MSKNKQKIQLHTSIKLSLTSNRAINMVVSATERSEPIFFNSKHPRKKRQKRGQTYRIEDSDLTLKNSENSDIMLA